MKVYVVTSGCYSDYTIEKVFTDRAKAEEYAEWLRDSNPVEEYDTEDDLVVDKYYKIIVQMQTYDKQSNEPTVFIYKGCFKNEWNNGYTSYVDCHKYSGRYFEITICRLIPAQNWNEEFYRNKYSKAIYDLTAIAKQKRAEGATEEDIQQLFKGVNNEME